LCRVNRIGAHIFYAMRDGVNWAPGALNGNDDRSPAANWLGVMSRGCR
jgi:hypothetical protein